MLVGDVKLKIRDSNLAVCSYVEAGRAAEFFSDFQIKQLVVGSFAVSWATRMYSFSFGSPDIGKIGFRLKKFESIVRYFFFTQRTLISIVFL